MGWGQSAIGICALCYIYLQVWCSGMQGFYVWLGVGMRSICHGYMCIMLYISANRSAMFGVVVCKGMYAQVGGQSVIDPWYTITPPLPIDHRSMLHCYTPSVCPGYLSCICICHVYMCIVLYLLELPSLVWNLFGVVVFKACMLNWLGGPSACGLYVHCPICETSLV